RARGELTLRAPKVVPLVLSLDARLEGETTRLQVSGAGGLEPLVAWLPPPAVAAVGGRPLEVALDADLTAARGLAAQGRLRLGAALAASGSVTVAKGGLEASLPSASADLAFVAAVAGLGWAPTGRAELSAATAAWRPETGGPTLRGTVRLAAMTLPPAAA